MTADKPDLSPDDQIRMFMHCAKCLAEIPASVSPAEYARLNVGWTPRGLQVWCTRHDANVVNIDFEGHQHPAITYTSEEAPEADA